MDDHPTQNSLLLHLYEETSSADRAIIAAHLTDCLRCRDTLAELEAGRSAWLQLPPPSLSTATWREMVRKAVDNRPPGRSPARPWVVALAGGIAAAAVIAAVGMFALLRRQRVDVDALRVELGETRALAALALLRESASTERLRGVSLGSTALGNEAVAAAFVRTLRHDPSPNVRLAVLDAVGNAPGDVAAALDLASGLAEEPLPAVRLAMVDLIGRLGDARARTRLAAAARDDPDSLVRAQARRALIRLGAGGSRARQ